MRRVLQTEPAALAVMRDMFSKPGAPVMSKSEVS